MKEWKYIGDEETRECLLKFFAEKKETLIAVNTYQYFWGNQNAEWRFLSVSSEQDLIGTIMEVSEFGADKKGQLIAQFYGYYVKNPKRVPCGKLNKPMFRNFRKAMYYNGKGSYGKMWMLHPTGEMARLGDIVKLLKGSIKEVPKEIKPHLDKITDRSTLRKNGFYMPTLKGGLKIATKKNELYVQKGDFYGKMELSKKKIAEVKNEQLQGLFAICSESKRGGIRDLDFEHLCRYRKDKSAKCLECSETIEDGERYYSFDCMHYFSPIFSHIYHWENKQQAKCRICGSSVIAEEIRGM